MMVAKPLMPAGAKALGEYEQLVAKTHNDGQPSHRQIAAGLARSVLHGENFLSLGSSGPQYTPVFLEMQVIIHDF